MINEPKHNANHRQRQRQPPAVAVGDETEQPAAERPHQERGGEQHGRVELLHHRVAVSEKTPARSKARTPCRRRNHTTRRDCRPRADEDRLDPAFNIGKIEMIGHRPSGLDLSRPASSNEEGSLLADFSPPFQTAPEAVAVRARCLPNQVT